MTKTIYSEEHKRLCAMLVEARNQLGLSQRELGRRLDKYQPYVARYERGQRRIDVVELLRIAKALNIKASEVVAELEE